MKEMLMPKQKHTGFTIVELIVVIVVIAILVTIIVVQVGDTRKRANDAKRIDDISKIVKAFEGWSLATNNDFVSMSAGSGGAEVGWFDTVYSGYPSVQGVLTDAGYLSSDIKDPIYRKSPASEAYAYMIAPCNNGDANIRVVLARLEVVPEQTPSEQMGVTCSGSTFTSYTTTYKMNYAKLIDLR